MVKRVDRASPRIYLAACNGATLKQAVLTIQKSVGSELEFYRLVLTNVSVTGITVDGTAGDDCATEKVTLDFQGVTVTYTQRMPDDSVGSRTRLDWSVDENSGSVIITPGLQSAVKFIRGAPIATLTWPSTGGRSYAVYFTDSLTNPFQRIPYAPARTNRQFKFLKSGLESV